MRSVAVPHTASSAADVRRAVLSDLRGAGLRSDVLHDVALVVTELVGNAVRHGAPLAGGSVRVSWELRPSTVRVVVQDAGGGGEPRARTLGTTSEGGRGLSIVSVVASDWGVDRRRDGLAVWADLPLRDHRR